MSAEPLNASLCRGQWPRARTYRANTNRAIAFFSRAVSVKSSLKWSDAQRDAEQCQEAQKDDKNGYQLNP